MSAYAHQCCQHGVAVDWRTPRLCRECPDPSPEGDSEAPSLGRPEGPITLVSICGVLTMCQASAWLVYIIPQVIKYPGGSSGKEPACQCRRHKRCKFNSGSRRSPGEGNGYSLQHPRLENPMDRGAWWVIVQRVAKGSDMTETT